MRMVEKMARASVRAGVGELDFDQWPEEQQMVFLRQMRAALEAMREPSADMIIAGVYRANGFASAGNRMCNGYRAMIDKAIQESGD